MITSKTATRPTSGDPRQTWSWFVFGFRMYSSHSITMTGRISSKTSSCFDILGCFVSTPKIMDFDKCWDPSWAGPKDARSSLDFSKLLGGEVGTTRCRECLWWARWAFNFFFFSVHRAIGTRAWKIALHVDVLCIGKNANSYHCFALGCWASWGSHLVFWKKINDFIERTYP